MSDPNPNPYADLEAALVARAEALDKREAALGEFYSWLSAWQETLTKMMRVLNQYREALAELSPNADLPGPLPEPGTMPMKSRVALRLVPKIEEEK